MPVRFGLTLLALAAATEGPNLLAGRQIEQENQLEEPVASAPAPAQVGPVLPASTPAPAQGPNLLAGQLEQKKQVEKPVGCVPYSEEACRTASENLGLTLGGGGYDFAGDYPTKGCYKYPDDQSGDYPNMAFYSFGGTDDDRKAHLLEYGDQGLVTGYDCYIDDPCYSAGYYEDPLGNIEPETVEADHSACQSRCAQTKYCSYFSFWAKSKACHLSSSDSTLISSTGVTAGLRVCSGGRYKTKDNRVGGENTCPVGFMHITSADACEVAAEKLGYWAADYGFKKIDETKPKNCYITKQTGAFWFNNIPSSAGAVPQDGFLTATICTPADYIVGAVNTNECTLRDITDMQSCEDTASALGFPWGDEINDNSRPKKCFVQESKVYWNSHLIGSPQQSSKPICTYPTPEDVYKEIKWSDIDQDPIVSVCNGYTYNKDGGMLVTAVPIKRGDKYYYYFHAVAHHVGSPITKIVIGGREKVEYNHTNVEPLDSEKNRGCKGSVCFIGVHKYRKDLLPMPPGALAIPYDMSKIPLAWTKLIKIVEFIAGPYNADEKISFTVSRPKVGGPIGFRGFNKYWTSRGESGAPVSLTVEIDGTDKQGDKCHREELKQESGKSYFVPQRDDVPHVAPPKKRDEDFVVTTYNVFGLEATISVLNQDYQPYIEEKETTRRLILIGKYVQSINPDIIGFTEVFWDYQVNILLEMLRDHCRHFVAPPRVTPILDTNFKLNGGLLICSKYPIENNDDYFSSFPNTLFKLKTVNSLSPVQSVINPVGAAGAIMYDFTRFFTEQKHQKKVVNDYVEALCEKGVMSAQVNIPWEHGDNHNVQVFLAHTLSTNDNRLYFYAEQRLKQFEVIHKAMQAGLQNHQGNSPITQQILMGDLNVDAVPSKQSCKETKLANASATIKELLGIENALDAYKVSHPWILDEYENTMMHLLNGGTVVHTTPYLNITFPYLYTLNPNKNVKLRDPVYERKKKSDNIPIIHHGDDQGCPTTWNTNNTWNIAAGHRFDHSQYLDYILFTDQTNQTFKDSFFHDNFSLKNITIGNPESATNSALKKEITTYHKELSDHRPLTYAWKPMEIWKCDAAICSGNGICSWTGPLRSCACKAGFAGTNCEKELEDQETKGLAGLAGLAGYANLI